MFRIHNLNDSKLFTYVLGDSSITSNGNGVCKGSMISSDKNIQSKLLNVVWFTETTLPYENRRSLFFGPYTFIVHLNLEQYIVLYTSPRRQP